ncbi:sensor histidine kinase [Thermus scotoductus]|nr:ATP-binding protein [Thermus scotoductus]
MGRALLFPLGLLSLLVAFWTSFEANRHLALLAEQEVDALAQAANRLADPHPLSGLGVRVTRRPETAAPLLGEEAKGVEVGLQGLRAWASVPRGQQALEVVRTYPLFMPPALLLFVLTLGTALWARARALAAVRQLLGISLREAKGHLAALEAAFLALEEGVAVLEGTEVRFLNPKALALLGLPSGAMTPISLRRVWSALADLREGAGEVYLPLPSGRPARVRMLRLGGYRVVLFQEQAELLRLAESLTQSRRHLELLRAQAHEFQNLLHVIGGLLELGHTEEALRLVQSELSAEAEIESLLARVEVPIVAALVLGKLRRARELGIAFRLEGRLPARYAPLAESLASLLGHLLENAMEAAAAARGASGEVEVGFCETASAGLEVVVRDNGPGLPPGGEALLRPGVSSRGTGRGYGLALARAQIGALGGSLAYHREEGWTVFRVCIPEPWTERSS